MSTITNSLSSLPIEDLVAGPLVASALAQSQLAQITHDFIVDVGLEAPTSTTSTDPVNAKTVSFSFVNANENTSTITVPLLAIVAIPSLSVKKVNVDFSIDIRTSFRRNVEAGATLEAKQKWWGGYAKFEGSVASKTTRTTDHAAKYSFSVEASDDGSPEGLGIMLGLLNNMIENTTKSSTEDDEADVNSQTEDPSQDGD